MTCTLRAHFLTNNIEVRNKTGPEGPIWKTGRKNISKNGWLQIDFVTFCVFSLYLIIANMQSYDFHCNIYLCVYVCIMLLHTLKMCDVRMSLPYQLVLSVPIFSLMLSMYMHHTDTIVRVIFTLGPQEETRCIYYLTLYPSPPSFRLLFRPT